MIALDGALGRAFPAALARFGDTLHLDAAEATPVADLLRPAGLDAIGARYATAFPGGDRRAVLSMWSQYYMLALVPAAVAAALVAEQDLPVALDGMGVLLSGAGQPTALCLPHSGYPAQGSCPVARLTPLLRGHLEPLAHGLAEAGLPTRVLWANAGAVLAWTLDVIAAPPEPVAAVREALCSACWADGGPNPLCPVLARRESGCAPGRRVCCLRFRLPGVEACGDCPRSRSATGCPARIAG